MYADLRCVAVRVLELLRSKRLERELDEEIRFHLAMLGEANLRRGMDARESQFAARRRLGSADLIKDSYRDERGLRSPATILADCKIAARMLRTDPRFTLGVAIVLALSVAATIMIASVVNAIVLRPLPYLDSDGIIQVTKAARGRLDDGHSYASFEAFRTRSRVFASIAAFEWQTSELYLDEIGEHVRAVPVSYGYFEVLRVVPVLGRSFLPEEERSGAANVVILSHRVWSTKFRTDRGVIGTTVSLNGVPHTVVGVTPADFRAVPQADVWVPLRIRGGNNANSFGLLGRLRSGVTLEEAQKDADRLNSELHDEFQSAPGQEHFIRLRRMHDVLVEGVRPICLLLLGTIALVHLIACLNTTNLVLARVFARARDTAVRIALGASRGRIIQLYLAESMMLALFSGALGLVGARAALPILSVVSGSADWNEISIDWTVLQFTIVVVIASGLLSGLLPALLISRVDPNRAMKEGRWRAVWSHGSVRKALVVGEVGFCVLLLVSSGLLIRSLASMRNSNVGFEPRQVVTAKLSTRASGDRAPISWTACLRSLERLQALPGIESVAIVSSLPTERGLNLPAILPGSSRPIGTVEWRYITPDYFRVMGIPLRRGRMFAAMDGPRSPAVAIVNRRFARAYFGTEDVVGQRIALGGNSLFQDDARGIVGVLDDVREQGLTRPAPPTVYVPASQVKEELFRYANDVYPMGWVARLHETPETLVDSFRRDLLAVSPELHFASVSLMQSVLARSLAGYGLLTLTVSAFAGFALLISIYGIYGAISYSVVMRQKELAIGLALGAPARKLLLSVASQGLILGLAGVAIGLLASLATKKLISSFVFGVSTTDPITLFGIALLIPCVAVAASFIPAVRATHIDPSVVLRCE